MATPDRPQNFTQVYPKGWSRMRALGRENPGAALLYQLFAENLTPNCGAIIADQAFLAEELNVSLRTIQRWIKYLKEAEAIVLIPVGSMYAYALDEEEVWKGSLSCKRYSAFTARALVSNDGFVRRSMRMMAKGRRAEVDLTTGEVVDPGEGDE